MNRSERIVNLKMINELIEYSKRPKLYEKSSAEFWDDEHISREMLKCHLNPSIEAASRSHHFIDKSVEWIQKEAPRTMYHTVLDLGCGPGLYAERLCHKGYSVTGIDLSKRSIAYAKERASRQGDVIQYIYKNYLDIDYQNVFDLILLVYCDFGVLSHQDRKILLDKVYASLAEKGKFIFDVFTPRHYEGKNENSHWYMNYGSGFWKPKTYMCLESHLIYENYIRLNQYIIIDEEEHIDVFRIWDHYYTIETIRTELENSGFRQVKIYGDISGSSFSEESETMCIVAEK